MNVDSYILVIMVHWCEEWRDSQLCLKVLDWLDNT